MINRVNPAMIAYRNMPKSQKKTEVRNKASSLMNRSTPTARQSAENENMSDAQYRMRTMMDHIRGLREEPKDGNA